MKRALPGPISVDESAWKSCKRPRKGETGYGSDSELSLVNYPFSSNHYIAIQDFAQEEMKEFFYERPDRLVLYLTIQWENVTALDHNKNYYHFSLVYGKKKKPLSIQRAGYLHTSQNPGGRFYHNKEKYVQSWRGGEHLRLELDKRNIHIDYGLEGYERMICKWFLNWDPTPHFEPSFNPLFCRIQTIGNVDFNKENWFDRWFLVQEIANQAFLPKDIGKLFAESIVSIIPTFSIRCRPIDWFDWSGERERKDRNIEMNLVYDLSEDEIEEFNNNF